MDRKLTINLITDDTVLYLSNKDHYNDVIKTLDKWCPGAKFNKEKTEIIPIGTKTHWEQVIQLRKLNLADDLIKQMST